jgi:large subunit ribosomal protein L21
MKDDIVTLPFEQDLEVGEQVVFDDILLMGTHQLTLIGRPTVESCKVYATVEEQTFSEKKVTLKYRPKKRIRKTKNKKIMMTVLRVDKVAFEPSEGLLERAVAL